MSSKKNDVTFEARVTPRSSKNEVQLEGGSLRIYLHTIPEDGKANLECIRLLSDFFSVPKRDISITRGMKSRSKVFCVKNISSDKAALLSRSGSNLSLK